MLTESPNPENETTDTNIINRFPLEIDGEIETFHDNDNGNGNGNGNLSLSLPKGGSIVGFFSPHHHHHHHHTTSSCLFLLFMTISSTTAFILQMYFIHLIFDMTARFYFCFPIIFFMCIEKTFAWVVSKRFSRIFQSLVSDSGLGLGLGSGSGLGSRSLEYKAIRQGHDLDEEGKDQQEQDEQHQQHQQQQQQQQNLYQETSPFSFYYHHEKSIHWCNILKVVCEVLTTCFLCICYLTIVPKITTVMDSLFQDIDGDISSDYQREDTDLAHLSNMSKCIGFLYVLVVSFAVFAMCTVGRRRRRRTSKEQYQRCDNNTDTESSPIEIDDEPFTDLDYGRNHEHNTNNIEISNDEQHKSLLNPISIVRSCRIVSSILFIASVLMLLISVHSIWTYLIDHKIPFDNNIGPHCDPIDTTECLLPFPSSFFTVEDKTTVTGSRINIEIDALRKMFKGRNNPKNPTNLNDLDGFHTSGPILFYLNGLKEGHGKGRTRLIGPEEMHLSITDRSMTLLVDIESKSLVPHFAEIDYLDETKPLVIIQPSKVLVHNRHYAVAVIDATDYVGKKLPVSNYLESLLRMDDNLPAGERKRGELYSTKVLPVLNEAASFLQNDQRIQLLFDFTTMSAECQLGNTKGIIQATLNQFEGKEWGGWNESNVRSIKVIDNDCSNREEYTGRIIHGSIDLPHFLQDTNTRIVELDNDAIREERPRGLFTVKFVASVPCSLKSGSNPVHTIIDYGHSFLYSRIQVLNWKYMQRMSNDHGYIMIAVNWRGMSMFDLPVLVKAFAGDINIFKSIRDNIIQGYAFKAGVTHFARHGLLDMDFMGPLKQDEDRPLQVFFHGISQGAILGSAYSTLVGPSNLLDGSAVISPASPFSLIMSRSTIFPDYEKLMLLNLRHKRHVRILISMVQMYYDSVEAGGLLATTDEEDRIKTLLIAGIGDPTVTTIATEVLARSCNASIFSNNPRSVYGLSTISSSEDFEDQNQNDKDLKCLLNEILYVEEESSLPSNNIAGSFNGVHLCVPSDPYIVTQLTEFFDNGNFVNVCPEEGCVRESSWDRLNAGECD